jgi:hypothetical protein
VFEFACCTLTGAMLVSDCVQEWNDLNHLVYAISRKILLALQRSLHYMAFCRKNNPDYLKFCKAFSIS